MSDFFEEFLEEVKIKDLGQVTTEYFLKYSIFDCFVFVEGLTDKAFYSCFLDTRVKNKNLEFIVCQGKTKLFKTLDYLVGGNYFRNKEHYHIIDKDFDGIRKYKGSYGHKLTTTRFYSFENYAFTKENIFLLGDQKIERKESKKKNCN